MFTIKLKILLIILASKRNTRKLLIETSNVNELLYYQRRQESACQWSEWGRCEDGWQKSWCRSGQSWITRSQTCACQWSEWGRCEDGWQKSWCRSGQSWISRSQTCDNEQDYEAWDCGPGIVTTVAPCFTFPPEVSPPAEEQQKIAPIKETTDPVTEDTSKKEKESKEEEKSKALEKSKEEERKEEEKQQEENKRQEHLRETKEAPTTLPTLTTVPASTTISEFTTVPDQLNEEGEAELDPSFKNEEYQLGPCEEYYDDQEMCKRLGCEYQIHWFGTSYCCKLQPGDLYCNTM